MDKFEHKVFYYKLKEIIYMFIIKILMINWYINNVKETKLLF